MRRGRALALALAALALAGCRDDRAATEPSTGAPALAPGDAPRFALASLTDAVPQLGWLAPLGTASAATPLDSTLSPVVTICEWTANACGATVAQWARGAGLALDSTRFKANWNLSASYMPETRKRYRIAVTLGGVVQGLPVFVDAMRGAWTFSVPGQTPALVPAARVPIEFRLGAPLVPPPEPALVVAGIANAGEQFLPPTPPDATPEQTTTLASLGSALGALGDALTASPDEARAALGTARTALDAARRVAPAGSQADLTVIQLELDQAGRLLGVGG